MSRTKPPMTRNAPPGRRVTTAPANLLRPRSAAIIEAKRAAASANFYEAADTPKRMPLFNIYEAARRCRLPQASGSSSLLSGLRYETALKSFMLCTLLRGRFRSGTDNAATPYRRDRRRGQQG